MSTFNPLDDQPKRDPLREDRLHFAPFAHRLFQAIRHLRAPNGYVIGLHGTWGSGKSTVLNFIRAHIEKHNQEAQDAKDTIIHIDFRPWMFSGHQDLISAFFKVLSESPPLAETRSRSALKRVARYLHGPADTLIDAIALIGTTVDPTRVGAGFAGALAKKSLNEVIGRFIEIPSLQASYDNLRDQLSKKQMKLLVTIDDLDRLNRDEIRSLMQMIKTTGKLPNFVYLLAYDRRILRDALDGDQRVFAPGYSEKIVQHEIDMPRASRHDLRRLLDECISPAPNGTKQELRRHYIDIIGINRWINSPRDVNRISNAFMYSWSALHDEIDYLDLLVMEGLRLFDEEAFHWVRNNRDFLFSKSRFAFADNDAMINHINAFKNTLRQSSRKDVLEILSLLFPNFAAFNNEGLMSSEPYNDVIVRRGVGCEQGYDAYFSLHPSADHVSKKLVDEVINNINDKNFLESIFSQLRGQWNSGERSLLNSMLAEILARLKSRDPPSLSQTFLDFIFSIGDEVLALSERWTEMEYSPRAQIGRLVSHVLQLWSQEDAGHHLVEAFEKSTSSAFCSDIYVTRGRELGILPGPSPGPPLVSSDAFTTLGTVLLAKIEVDRSEGRLDSATRFLDIVTAWSHLAGSEAPKHWLLEGVMRDPRFFVKAAKALVNTDFGSGSVIYTFIEEPDDDLYDLVALVDSGTMYLNGDALTDDERRLISEVVRGCQKFLKHRSLPANNY